MNSNAFFTNRKIVFLLASLCCLLWGSAYPAIKNGYALFGIAPGDIPSQLVFAGYRFLFAGLVLLEATTPEMAESPGAQKFLDRVQMVARASAIAGSLGLSKIAYYKPTFSK